MPAAARNSPDIRDVVLQIAGAEHQAAYRISLSNMLLDALPGSLVADDDESPI
jgi:hypothetical protein